MGAKTMKKASKHCASRTLSCIIPHPRTTGQSRLASPARIEKDSRTDGIRSTF
jgi:hypothetical protein